LYRYAVEEDLLDHSPAAHARRPRIDYESRATGPDRNEVGALLVAAGLGTAAEHALVSLLALNGLRVSEATGADISALGTERGHRTLTITRTGGKNAASTAVFVGPVTLRRIRLPSGPETEADRAPETAWQCLCHLGSVQSVPFLCWKDTPRVGIAMPANYTCGMHGGTKLAPKLIFLEVAMCSDLVGATGFEPVTPRL